MIVKILVIDDNHEMLKLIKEMLEYPDKALVCKTTICSNSSLGKSMAESNSFDIVITDFYMPGVDGFEILFSLHKLRKEGKFDSYIIVMTGGELYDDISCRKIISELGVCGVLKKTF